MNHPYVGKFLRLLLFSFLLCVTANAQQAASSEDELKKQAEKAFVAEKYEDALSPYSQLLSLYPRNATYNYRYGVALLKAGKNKTNAVSYLETAAKDPSNPEEVWIYLGQAYMIIGKFDDALGSFRKFESIVTATKLKKFNSEELIANCMNAIELLKTRKNITIVSSKEVALNEFYKFYSWTNANGKLVPAAEQFLTSMDKDKQVNPVMFIANDKQTIYLSSYGKKGDRGKDLYIIRKMPNGQWSEPENLGETINSEANEDYPYLDRDGRTLYFSSKSKKSIGGYDIFKSKFDFNTGKWSVPENLGWPINTITDDHLYVPITGTNEAFYATCINTSKNEIEIRRIQLPDQGEALVTITGYYAPTDQKVRRDARITIMKGDGQGIVTSVYTDPYTGKYEVTLEPGQDYIIVVEGGGYLAHSENFSLPSQLNNSELKQIVKVTREKSNENLTIENYFYPSNAVRDVPSEVKTASYDVNPDTSAMMAVQINNQTVMVTKPGTGKTEIAATPESAKNDNLVTIEKKDEYDPTLEKGPTADEIKQQKEEEARANEVSNDSKKSDNYDITIGNEELANIAILDAKTSRAEADSLLLEVERLKAGAIERDSLSAQAMSKAENASEQDKTSYLNEAYTMKADADNMRRQAADLSVAAVAKDTEAKASEEEAGMLLAAINDGKGKKDGKSVAENKGVKSKPVGSDSGLANNKSQSPEVTKSDEIKELSPSETPVSTNQPETKQATNDIASAEIKDSSAEKVAANDNTEIKSGGEDKNIASANPETAKPLNTKKEVSDAEVVKKNTDIVSSENSSDNKDDSKSVSNDSKDQTVTAIESNNAENNSATEKQNPVDVKDSSKEQSVADNVSHEKSVESNTDLSNDSKTSGKKEVDSQKAKTDDLNENHVAVNDQVLKNENKTESPLKNDSSISFSQNQNSNTEKGNTARTETDETVSSKDKSPEIVNEPATSNDVVKNESDSVKINNEGDQLAVDNAQQKVADSEKGTESRTEGVNSSKTISESEVKDDQKTSKDDAIVLHPSEQNDQTKAIVENKSISDKKDPALNQDEKKSEEDVTSKQDQVAQNTGSISENETNRTAQDQNVKASDASDAVIKSDSVSQVNELANTSTERNKSSEEFTSKVELKPPFIIPSEEQKPFPPDINTLKVNPVSEEARIAYQAYKTKYRNAKQLSDQSVDLQNRIVNASDSPEKDSLILISNDLTDQSTSMYTEAQNQLKAAQTIDPEVKSKMELNEQIIAYNSSMPTNNTNNAGGPTLNSADERKADANPETKTGNISDTKTDSVEQPIVSNSTETSGDKVESTPAESVTTETTEKSSENTTVPAESAPVVNEYALTPEEAKAVDEATTFTVETPNGKEVVKIDTVGINTRHPDFQKYVEVNKEITNKQVETIDVFAAAVNQQKLAVEQKQEQNKLMDQAEVEQDRPTKAQIFIKADAYRDSSKKNEEEAAAKFALAQNKTAEVKSKTIEMQEIRKQIAIPGRELPKQATKSKINPQGLTQEELTAMSQPKAEVEKPNRNTATNTTTAAAPVSQSSPASIYTPEKVQAFAKQSFSIASAPVYNKENPIPMNPPIPDGLVFKVQIGAFRNEIPAEKFSGVQPITAETTRPGWVRYCVGLFQTFEPAVVVKKEMQQRGFKDAFVVAYLNGKRIGLDEAYAMIAKNKAKPDNDYVASSQTEMALLRANNIRPENISSIRNNVIDEDEKTFYGDNAANVKKSLAVVEYAVQVGVYKTQTTPRGLQTLTPLFTEKIRNNLYRFTSDHFINYASADSMKRIARREGVKDAFIVVYRNGVQSALASVPVSERNTRSTIAIPEPVVSQPEEKTESKSTPSANTNTLPAFPSATITGGAIIYRVQLGAFRNNIPFTAVVSFLNVADKGITQQTDDRGLHIFYAGTCNKFSEAATLKEEIVSKGVTDAFVVALQDGKRVVLTDEMKK